MLEQVQDMAQRHADTPHIAGGAVISGSTITAPLWVESLTAYVALCSAVVGLFVGLATFYLLLLKIKEKHGR